MQIVKCIIITSDISSPYIPLNTVNNIEVIEKNVFSHTRVMVIGVSSDLKCCNFGIEYLVS